MWDRYFWKKLRSFSCGIDLGFWISFETIRRFAQVFWASGIFQVFWQLIESFCNPQCPFYGSRVLMPWECVWQFTDSAYQSSSKTSFFRKNNWIWRNLSTTTFNHNYLSGIDLQFWLWTKNSYNLILDNLILLPELILRLYNKKAKYHWTWNVSTWSEIK